MNYQDFARDVLSHVVDGCKQIRLYCLVPPDMWFPIAFPKTIILEQMEQKKIRKPKKVFVHAHEDQLNNKVKSLQRKITLINMF